MEKENTKNIYQKMLDVMDAVKYVKKTAHIKFGNTDYKGVTHDAVAAAVRPALIKNRLVLLPTVISVKTEGKRTSVSISVDIINADNPEEKLSTASFGDADDVGDKGFGKAYSYAVKYALLKLFHLETGENDEERVEVKTSPPVNVKTSPVKTKTSPADPKIQEGMENKPPYFMRTGIFDKKDIRTVPFKSLVSHYKKHGSKWNKEDIQAFYSFYPSAKNIKNN